MFMDEFIDEPSEATIKQKLITKEDNKNFVLVTLDRQNVDLPKVNIGTTLKYKSGTEQSAAIRSSYPSFIRTSALAAGALVSEHAQLVETKRLNTTPAKSSSPSSPSTGCSSPSPLSGSIMPSSPISKSSTPPSFVSSRSTTPERDTIVENKKSSRRSFGGQASDGLLPARRSLSYSFESEYFVHFSKKDGPVGNSIIDNILRKSSIAVSERKRTALIGRNTSEESKIHSLVQGTHSRVVDQHRWPAMNGGKVSNMTFSRSMDFTDRIGKAASLMLQSQGISPTRRDPLSDDVSKNIHKSSNVVAQHTSLKATMKVELGTNFGINMDVPYIQNGKVMPFTNPNRTLSLPLVTLCRPSSPNSAPLLSSSTSKRTQSPSNTSVLTPSFSSNNTSQTGTLPPEHGDILDIKEVIKGADMEDVHQLRLLYNRALHWHFVNSQTEVTSAIQKVAAESCKIM